MRESPAKFYEHGLGKSIAQMGSTIAAALSSEKRTKEAGARP